jgi:YHS domain-containing protein
MRFFPSFIAATMIAFASTAMAGEFKDECAWGLANGKHVKTDCSINMAGEDGKTYCFSSADAKNNFMKDAKTHARKASETFGRS